MDRSPDALRLAGVVVLLQVMAAVSLLLGVVALLVVYRHMTDAVFTPVGQFVLSANLAIPPLFVGLATYFVVILLGEDVKETRVRLLGWIRTELMASHKYLLGLILLGALVSFSVGVIVSNVTPPRYEAFVSRLLGGEQDRFTLAKEDLANIAKSNPMLARQYSLVLQVFEERARANFASDEASSPARARLLVRALETDVASDWKEHPLRWHGLAEAYALWAQGAAAHDERWKETTGDTKRLYGKSVELYERVRRSGDPRATSQLKLSAGKNIGNVRYYQHDLQGAFDQWRAVNSENRELGLWGNAVAALVQLGRLDDAIAEAGQARKWAEESGKAVLEPSGYSSILVNEAFAHLLRRQPADAVRLLAEAVNVEDDQLNRLNLVYAWIVLGQRDRAERYLRRFIPPVDPANQAEVVLGAKGDRCGYLLWALADPDAPRTTTAARLRAYLGEARSSSELDLDARDIAVLRKRALEHLESETGLCHDFRLVPDTAHLLAGPDVTSSEAVAIGPGDG